MKKQRIKKLQTQMKKEGIDAAFICANPNMFYFYGRTLTGYLYIPQEGMPVLFVKMPVGIEGAVYYKSPKQLPALMQEQGICLHGQVWMDMGNASAQEYLLFSTLFPAVRWWDGSDVFRSIRAVKDEEEIGIFRETCRVHTDIYRKIKKLYRPGMTDRAFSAAIEHESRLHGHQGLFRTYGHRMQAHMGLVLAGENGAVPPAFDYALGGAGDEGSYPLGDTGAVMQEGCAVMVDVTNNLFGYISDMSRTFSVGSLPDEAYAAHEVSLEIHRKMMKIAKPGIKCCDLYFAALEIAENSGFGARYMGREQKAKFLGHGVGIEVNELPVFAPKMETVLEKNMVFALEPKFIVDGVGAVGIENTYLLTEKGLENLTNCPEEIIDLCAGQ